MLSVVLENSSIMISFQREKGRKWRKIWYHIQENSKSYAGTVLIRNK